MGKFKDLTGQRFGKLTVIEPTEERCETSIVWRCVCDCGNETFTAARSLVKGNTRSCGCLRGRARMNLTGQRFGKLTALEYDAEKKKWLCRCDCGNEKMAPATYLTGRHVESCGCMIGRPKDLRGARFGKLTAIEPTENRANNGAVVWRCKCDCGNEALVDTNSLVRNKTKSCGCLRRKTLNPDEIVFE